MMCLPQLFRLWTEARSLVWFASPDGEGIAKEHASPKLTALAEPNYAIAYLVCRTIFILLFIDFHIKCSNEDIFVLPLANPHFLAYVSRGWWVGDATHYNVRAHEVAYETGGVYLPSWGTEHCN